MLGNSNKIHTCMPEKKGGGVEKGRAGEEGTGRRGAGRRGAGTHYM